MKAMLARREERYISYMNTSVSLMSTLSRSIRCFTSHPSRAGDSLSRVATVANSLGRFHMSLTNVEQAPGGSSHTNRSSKRLRCKAAACRDRNGPRLSGLGRAAICHNVVWLGRCVVGTTTWGLPPRSCYSHWARPRLFAAVATRLRNPQTKTIPNATYLKDIPRFTLEGTTVLWDKMNFGARSRRMNRFPVASSI